MNTPDNLTKLEKGQIFVFGSNLGGKHLAGAARVAKDQFGALEGVGEGPTGSCYALPTLDRQLRKRSDEDLTMSIRKFFKYAENQLHLTFLVTKVGCGIAGYSVEYMASKFRTHPVNVIIPKEFQSEYV